MPLPSSSKMAFAFGFLASGTSARILGVLVLKTLEAAAISLLTALQRLARSSVETCSKLF